MVVGLAWRYRVASLPIVSLPGSASVLQRGLIEAPTKLPPNRTKATLRSPRCGSRFWGTCHVNRSFGHRCRRARVRALQRRLLGSAAGSARDYRRRGSGRAPRGRCGRHARRDALGVEGSGRRSGAELRGGCELAEAAPERLAHRPGRRNCRGLARQHLGLSPAADARRELGWRDAENGDERPRRADKRARPSKALRRTQHGLLCPGAVRAQVRPRREPAHGMGRTLRSGLPRQELPRGGRLFLAGARARHLRRPQRLRVRRPATARTAGPVSSRGWRPIRGRRTSATTRTY